MELIGKKENLSTVTSSILLQAPASTAVFGVPLGSLAGEDNLVPLVLDRLIEVVDQRGLYVEGIYRRSGAAARVRVLKKALDTGKSKSQQTLVMVYVFLVLDHRQSHPINGE